MFFPFSNILKPQFFRSGISQPLVKPQGHQVEPMELKNRQATLRSISAQCEQKEVQAVQAASTADQELHHGAMEGRVSAESVGRFLESDDSDDSDLRCLANDDLRE